MRILGIDYGTKRIGLAISDDGEKIAFPKEIIKNDSSVLVRIGNLIKTECIAEVVIGESLDLKGQENKLQEKIKVFSKQIEDFTRAKIFLQKEFMTSIDARRTKIFKNSLNQTQASSRVKKKKEEKVDAHAAAIILQRYLDKKNIKNK